MDPKKSWKDGAAFEKTLNKLGQLFIRNFKTYEDQSTPEILAAAPNGIVGVAAPSPTVGAPSPVTK